MSLSSLLKKKKKKFEIKFARNSLYCIFIHTTIVFVAKFIWLHSCCTYVVHSFLGEIQEKKCNQHQTKANENSTSDHASSRGERPSQLLGLPMIDEDSALLDSHDNQSSPGSINSKYYVTKSQKV